MNEIPPDFFNEAEMEQYRKDNGISQNKGYIKYMNGLNKLFKDMYNNEDMPQPVESKPIKNMQHLGRKIFINRRITTEDILNCDFDLLIQQLQF